MKVLVVEDDAATRRILSRLMSSSFGAEVQEAENGMAALIGLEHETPDLILTDVNMPMLDGFGLLQAVRASPTHSDIPVVAVTATSERSEVTRLIELGIADFLLKPLDVAAASKRLARVVQDIRTKPKSARRRSDSNARPRLLLVEADPNFRELFKGLVQGMFEVFDAPSGPKGLALAAEQGPSIVCLAEGLGLLNERLLAKHLRELATPPESIYLLHADEKPKSAEGFDGTLRKSFVPEVMVERWRALTVGNDLAQAVAEAIAALGSEVVTATQQTFGVMTQQEVDRISDEDAATVPADVGMMARLIAPGSPTSITVAIHATKADGEKLAGAILGETMPWEEGGNEAFGALVETLAGRVRSSFDARSIKLTQEPVEPMPAGGLPNVGYRAAFSTPTGERFAVVVTSPDD